MNFFDLFTRTALEDNLKHYAFIVGEQYKASLAHGSGQLEPVAADQLGLMLSKYGGEVGARIQVVSTNGIVVLDSKSEGVGSSLLERPEIREALHGGYSARSRLTLS